MKDKRIKRIEELKRERRLLRYTLFRSLDVIEGIRANKLTDEEIEVYVRMVKGVMEKRGLGMSKFVQQYRAAIGGSMSAEDFIKGDRLMIWEAGDLPLRGELIVQYENGTCVFRNLGQVIGTENIRRWMRFDSGRLAEIKERREGELRKE